MMKNTTVLPSFAALSSAFSLAIASRHRSNPLLRGSYRPLVKKYSVFSRSNE